MRALAFPGIAGLLAAAALAAQGCGYLAAGPVPLDARPLVSATQTGGALLPASLPAQMLLASGEEDWGEDDWGVEAAQPQAPPEPAAPRARGTVILLRIGGGLGLPGSGAIGSAPGQELPVYSEVWDLGPSFEAAGDFRPDATLRPYAQYAMTSFYGKKWTNPANPADAWWASDSALSMLGAGVKLGGKAYGKVGLAIFTLPEVSRVDAVTGNEIPILRGGELTALTFGGGLDLKAGGIRLYADVEYVSGPTPEKADNAVILWPQFETADGVSYIKIAGGIGFTF